MKRSINNFPRKSKVKLSSVFPQMTDIELNFCLTRCFLTDWVTVSTSGSSGILNIYLFQYFGKFLRIFKVRAVAGL